MPTEIKPKPPPSLVLLIEDEPIQREIITQILEDLGAQVTAFITADEGIDALPLQLWDLVITDGKTPGRASGRDLAVAATLRPSSRGVVLTSGYYEQMHLPLPPGIRFLPKPWSLNEFIKVVAPYLEHLKE